MLNGTLKEYFDSTAAHLNALPHRAGNGASCEYLADDGTKCAVGCHIPDGHDAQYFSGDALDMINSYPDLDGVAVPLGNDGHILAMLLQAIHDKSWHWHRNEDDYESKPSGPFNDKGRQALKYLEDNWDELLRLNLAEKDNYEIVDGEAYLVAAYVKTVG